MRGAHAAAGGIFIKLAFYHNVYKPSLMESNIKYSVKERLPTLGVDKALLKSIENYFFKNIPNLIDKPKNRIKKGYTIRIVDVDNELTLDSIDSYEHDLLPIGTREIRVNFRSHNIENNISADVQIRFAKERFSSKVELEITCPNPKEVATGILKNLREIFDPKKTTTGYSSHH
jgi:hypothetical protein